MKKEILSLKSIYKFLTLNDYPVFSEGIIKKDNRTGLTLTKFCHENILVDFKNRKAGKIIWRTEGGRNRYISEICNRSDRLGIYREYAKEILIAADNEAVLRQIRQFMSFLMERQFNYHAFSKKLPDYGALISKEDDGFSNEAKTFFENGMKEIKNIEEQGLMINAFCCSWILTFLMFHALVGNGENEEILRRLRRNKALSLENLLEIHLSKESEKNEEVVFLTNTNTELNCPPLKAGHFFGREEQLFELKEMLVSGGNYLVSGIGGIGKTELMRQFLKACVEERLTDFICVVQYEGGLAKSLVKAFSQIRGSDLNENFEEALVKIRVHAGKRILLVIDNMDGGIDETQWEALRELPATIFVTSRYQKLKGFKTYRLKDIDKEAGSLIFRDNYGTLLGVEDRKALEGILNNELWCHTLTLRLLAKISKNNGWTLQKLQQQLEKGNTSVDIMKQERYEGLKQVYCNMYAFSGLSKSLNSLLRMFAALPYKKYEIAFAHKYLQGFLDKDESMEESLEKLWVCGWLEKQEDGYSMHPFISECVLSAPLYEEDCVPFFDSVRKAWEMTDKGLSVECIPDMIYNWDLNWEKTDTDLQQVTVSVLSVVDKMAGRFSSNLADLALLATTIESRNVGVSKKGVETLLKLRSKTGHLASVTELCLYVMLCSYGYDKVDILGTVFGQLQEDAGASDMLKFTFADVLANQYYHLGMYAKAEELVAYILDNCHIDVICMAACLVRSSLMIQKGDFNGYGQWLEKGVEIGRTCKRENCRDMQLLLSGLCAFYLAFRKFDDARIILEELQKQTSNKTYFKTHQILFYSGSLAMHRGDEGYGVEALQESCKYAEVLYGGVENDNYAMNVVELAMAYNKAKQFKEAAKCYKQALEIYDALQGHDFEKHRVLNNMSVMYLDWGKPKEALTYLNPAYEMGKNFGGLAEGESANNLSKAWRALGEREKELLYLKEAVPILEQFYGSEHPKVIDAKTRMKEDIR